MNRLWARGVAAIPLAVVFSALPASAPGAAAPRTLTTHFSSGVPAPASGCAALGTCHYVVLHPARLHVMNGPTNANSADIDYDIYLPDNATAATPQPAIMYFNGFGGAKDDSSGAPLGKFFASHGYVYLPFTSEGFGHSAGTIELDSPEFDVKNARRLIDVLAAQDYVLKDAAGDPRIGLTGGSYGGAIQLEVAEFDQRVDAITPFRTWNSLEYSLGPNNLRSNYQFQTLPCCGILKTEWTSLFFASGLTQPFSGNGSGQGGLPGQLPCPGYDPRLCNAYIQAVATNSPSPAKALVDNSSPASYFNGGSSFDQVSGGLNIPTLLGQGEEDTLFNLNDAIASYRAIKARSVPVKMLWHSNGHGYPDQPGEDDAFGGDVSNPNQNYIPQRLLAWFNRYLRLDTGTDTGPTFAYFRDWVPYDHKGSAATAYGTASTFPNQSSVVMSLSGASDLVLPGQPVVVGTATLINPAGGEPASYTETSNFQCSTCSLPGGAPSPFSGVAPTNPPCVSPTCEYADFTSPAFARDVVSVGVPTAHLHLGSATGSAVVFYGKVFDVAPDGSAELIKRLISPVRVFDPGRAVDFQLAGFAHRFAIGHRVRLEIAATDMTSGNNRAPDVITLATGGADAATFSLPVDSTQIPTIPAPVTTSATVPRVLPNTAAGAPPGSRGVALLAGAALLLVLGALAVAGLTYRTLPRSASK
ncbi:MAG: CocE/NonD family hydrolase [Candidatus Dormibacteria bacterium]